MLRRHSGLNGGLLRGRFVAR